MQSIENKKIILFIECDGLLWAKAICHTAWHFDASNLGKALHRAKSFIGAV
jgi:hypothetical protein